MRELKFRAFDGLSMRYDVTGFEHGQLNEMKGVFLDGEYHEIKPEFKAGSITFHPPAIVMQFTGLKDMNGKDIYEGDFIGDSYFNILGEVYFNEKEARFESGAINIKAFEHFAVKGNIYENHELLEQSS